MAVIDRTGAAALIPEDASSEIIQGVPSDSAVLQLAKRLPNMSRKQTRLPVLSTLPTAYFVNGDTGLKQTSSVSWENVYLNAEELAVIVPIPEAVLEDNDYDIWGQIRPLITEALGVAIDAAILHGTNAPDAWPDDLMTQITAASHTVDEDTAAYPDLYDAILGRGTGDEASVFALVEEDGFMVNGSIAQPVMRSKLRGLRSSDGLPIFSSDFKESTTYSLDGEPIEFVKNGALAATVRMISGDWNQLVFSMRQDIRYKMATEATIQSAGGSIEYNLFQQDMVAMRVTMRLAWALPNPLNRVNQTDATRLPFAALLA
jgi:HK97 family phage major capsid protein